MQRTRSFYSVDQAVWPFARTLRGYNLRHSVDVADVTYIRGNIISMWCHRLERVHIIVLSAILRLPLLDTRRRRRPLIFRALLGSRALSLGDDY